MQRLSIAIPDSILSDTPSLREKTVRIGLVARACSIFKVGTIYIYMTRYPCREDLHIASILLKYLETPQYLRKRFFGRMSELGYAGLLPPLRTSHHKLSVQPSQIQVGEYREGVVVKVKGRLLVDVGLSILPTIEGDAHEGARVTVRFTSPYPELKCRVVDKSEVKEYWGYDVKESPSLSRLIGEEKPDLTILTSRLGMSLAEVWGKLCLKVKAASHILIAYGSPKQGLQEILREEGVSIEELDALTINMIPDQGTATVRTEEALLASLALINLARHLKT